MTILKLNCQILNTNIIINNVITTKNALKTCDFYIELTKSATIGDRFPIVAL